MKNYFIAALVLVAATQALGQAQGRVQPKAPAFSLLPAPPAGAAAAASVPGPRPTHGSIFDVDAAALKAALAAAPAQRLDARLRDYGLRLSLPGPEGQLIDCRVARSPVMEPGLAAQFPGIETFIVESADLTASGRIELAPRGITGMLRSDQGVWMIDPWQSADPAHAVAYWLADLPGGNDWTCHTTVGIHGFGTAEVAHYQERTTQTLHTFRLAMACTGEWGLHQCDVQGHAANPADPLAAIVTVVARANVVYEADFAIHLNLVANESQVIYTDPTTDPYPTTCDGSGGADCSSDIMNTNISVMSSRIGNANFDIGHVLSRVAGGVAYLSAVCGGEKAGGCSGIPRGGDIDPFTALVCIHEMGHQFGTNHTFSGTRGRCAGNVNTPTAWEAGSGSSPMAYPGGCPVGDAPPTDNVAQFADPFFHHGSYGEVSTFLPTASCAVLTPTSNNIPVIVSTSTATAIPPGTPFTLSATATDADSDLLTYSWEEYDSGFARPLTGPDAFDNGQGALFRVFPPVQSPQRTFPQMSDVLSGVATPGEMLPTFTGVTRRFRVIVRDNHPGAGGVAVSPFINLQIPTGTSPFAVTLPTGNAVVRSGPSTVTWSVGGTSGAPISCSTVTIRLSTDNGVSFTQVLGTFPNNGSAAVTLPAISTTARVRIDANNQVFFAMSHSFPLRLPCSADFNHDGDIGTDADIEAFFACIAGNCCAACDSADYDGDGDVATDADIEAFFRVLAGGSC